MPDLKLFDGGISSGGRWFFLEGVLRSMLDFMFCGLAATGGSS